MEYTIDNIDKLFSNIAAGPNPNVKRYVMYCGYRRDRERMGAERNIALSFGAGCYYATKISDDLAVVEQRDLRGNHIGYLAWVAGKPNYIIWDTFDQALICAITIKYTGKSTAAPFAMKVMDVERLLHPGIGEQSLEEKNAE